MAEMEEKKTEERAEATIRPPRENRGGGQPGGRGPNERRGDGRGGDAARGSWP